MKKIGIFYFRAKEKLFEVKKLASLITWDSQVIRQPKLGGGAMAGIAGVKKNIDFWGLVKYIFFHNIAAI